MNSINNTNAVENFQEKVATTVRAWKRANAYQDPQIDFSQSYSSMGGLQKALIRRIHSVLTNDNP